MSTLRTLLVFSLALSPCLAGDDEPTPLHPRAFHVGTYATPLGARVDAEGRIDTGDGILSLVDGATGEPLVTDGMQYSRGPKLTLEWENRADDVTVGARMVTIPLAAGGDVRLVSAILLSVENRDDEPRSASFGLRLAAGGEDTDDVPRPVAHLPYDPASRYAYDGERITRDDRVLLRWVGAQPDVTCSESPAGPDDTVCTVMWDDLVVPARTLLSISVFLAGPPSTDTTNEARWRRLFESLTYIIAEERAAWQAQEPAIVRTVKIGEKRTFRTLRSAIHMVRLLGATDDFIHEIRTRPYGLPGTTPAERAEGLVPFIEWNMPDAASRRLRELVDEAGETISELPADERLALCAAFAQCARLGGSVSVNEAIAALIAEHVCEAGLGGVPVRPWQDPGRVADAMRQVLDDAGLDAEVPAFAWADVEPDTPAAAFQALRRAISARDVAAVDEHLATLHTYLDANTIGRMDPDGEPDTTFGLAFLACVRAMFVDDHGDELVLTPAVSPDLMRVGAIDSMMIPSRYGLVRVRAWWTSRRQNRVNLELIHVPRLGASSAVWVLPEDREIEDVRVADESGYELRGGREVVVFPDGGRAQLEVKFAK